MISSPVSPTGGSSQEERTWCPRAVLVGVCRSGGGGILNGDNMTKLLLIFAAIAATTAAAAPLPEAEVNRLADAIYRAEGGAKARAPYGILSVKVANEADARRVCMNTIRNNWTRWEKAGRPGLYVDFLADKYCPPSADLVGNRNWKKNVGKIWGRR